MDDGELDFSNQEVLSSSIMGEFGCNCSMDSLFDDIMKDIHACTHTHTCNPPGPDNEHTHTCLHVHTKIVPASTEEKMATEDTAESDDNKSKRRPLGNRVAVRKYREKKKARAASLEEEVLRLRAVNQQLVKRLKGQAVLEAEVARLKCLLVDIRGRIDGEIGCFPYQKPAHPNLNGGGYVMNQCNVRCDDQLFCSYAGVVGQNGIGNGLDVHEFAACGLDDHQCPLNPNSELTDIPPYGSSISNVNKRKDGGRAENASRS